MEIETNPLYQQYITAVRMLEAIFKTSKNIPNDADLGNTLRKFCDENESLMPFVKDQNYSQQPVTKHVVDEAMRQVAKDVRAPLVVRKGLVKKPKTKAIFVASKESYNVNTLKTSKAEMNFKGLTREGFDKW